MTNNVTATDIAQSLRGRIESVRRELERHDALRDELGRLETALAELEPEAPSRRGARSKQRATAGRSERRSDARSQATTSGSRRRSGTRGPRGQTRERIIEFLRASGPATAGEAASARSSTPSRSPPA